LDETAPENVLEVTARAVTYYLDVSAECTRRIVAVDGAIKAICNRLVVVDPSSRTSKDLSEQCIKVMCSYSFCVLLVWKIYGSTMHVLQWFSTAVVNFSDFVFCLITFNLVFIAGFRTGMHKRTRSSVWCWWPSFYTFLHLQLWQSHSQGI